MTNREAFRVQDLTAEPGTTAYGYCAVDVGPETLQLPIAVLHGANPGPTLTITAGIHGGEYVPIVAARQFIRNLDATTVSGTIVVSLLSSPNAFLARREFTNPIDGQNLNRLFPGSINGGPTQKLAHWLWENIISRGDAYIDCHCGDLPEHLQGFAGIVLTGNPEVDDRALDLADCFAVERTLNSSTPGSTIWAAAKAGIPAALIEFGEEGRWTEAEVHVQVEGLQTVVRQLGLLTDDAMTPSRHPLFKVAAGLDASTGGLWFPSVRPGQEVSAGQSIGRIEDPFGELLEDVVAPLDGLYVYGLSSLAVRAGDFLGCFATAVDGQV